LSLAVLMLGWLLLQTVLMLLGRDPVMLHVGRTFTQALVVAIPLCVWLLRKMFPDADVPPEKLETLLMVAAFGFATALMLRWLLQIPRAAAGPAALAAAA